MPMFIQKKLAKPLRTTKKAQDLEPGTRVLRNGIVNNVFRGKNGKHFFSKSFLRMKRDRNIRKCTKLLAKLHKRSSRQRKSRRH